MKAYFKYANRSPAVMRQEDEDLWNRVARSRAPDLRVCRSSVLGVLGYGFGVDGV